MRDKLMTVEETTEKLGRTVFAVYRLVERRQIPFRKAGRRTVFVESELRASVETFPVWWAFPTAAYYARYDSPAAYGGLSL